MLLTYICQLTWFGSWMAKSSCYLKLGLKDYKRRSLCNETTLCVIQSLMDRWCFLFCLTFCFLLVFFALERSKPIMFIEITGLVRIIIHAWSTFPECRITFWTFLLSLTIASSQRVTQPLVNMTWIEKSVFCAWVNILPLLVCVSVAIVPLYQVAYNRLLQPFLFFLDQWSQPAGLESFPHQISSTEIFLLHE